MRKIISTEKVPIRLWLDDIEEGALQQAKNMANLPFTFSHVAIMPDSHEGYGMPIGGVLATNGVIVPNAVGVNIGCGMFAVKTNLEEITEKKESFQSCSHGAGRLMGRKEAQRTLDLDAEIAKLDAKGIIHAVRNQNDLDESPGAYKDIDVVMENQKDLVDILVELLPLAVIKG